MTVALPDPYVGGPVQSPEELRQRFEAIQRNFEAIATEFPLRAQHIANESISSDQIVNATITATDIANATIIGANIANATIVGANIANATIAAANLIAGTITANEIADATITANEIADATITGLKIASGTITGSNIDSATILGSNIDSLTITASNIANATITAAKMTISQLDALSANMGTLTAGKVLIGTAGGAKVAIGEGISTSAGSKDGIVGADSSNDITFWIDPTTGDLQLKGQLLSGSSGLGNITGTVDGSQIGSGVVTGTHIAADTIVAGNIAADAIGTSELAAGSVTATEISVSQLSAITADLGTITAGTITGATIRTGSSDPRVELTSSELAKYDSSGNKVFRVVAGSNSVEFLAGSTVPPEDERRIKWLTGSTPVASVYGQTGSGPYALNLTGSGDGTHAGQVTMTAMAVGSGGLRNSQIQLNTDSGNGSDNTSNYISISVAGVSPDKTLLKGDGSSDWEFKNRNNLKTVTSLPGSPVDGQEVLYLADSTNGILWHLKYRSASGSSYKWEFIGGPPLIAEVSSIGGADESTSSSTYADMGTSGPSVTLPLAGDYDVAIAFEGYANAAGQQMLMSYAIGGTAAVDADSAQLGAPAADALEVASRERRKTGLAASTTLTSKYKLAGGGTYFKARWRSIKATPVRLG